jgi:hypothetical protein
MLAFHLQSQLPLRGGEAATSPSNGCTHYCGNVLMPQTVMRNCSDGARMVCRTWSFGDSLDCIVGFMQLVALQPSA